MLTICLNVERYIAAVKFVDCNARVDVEIQR